MRVGEYCEAVRTSPMVDPASILDRHPRPRGVLLCANVVACSASCHDTEISHTASSCVYPSGDAPCVLGHDGAEAVVRVRNGVSTRWAVTLVCAPGDPC
jgi:Zn-dependent alcohol dehydrogenase